MPNSEGHTDKNSRNCVLVMKSAHADATDKATGEQNVIALQDDLKLLPLEDNAHYYIQKKFSMIYLPLDF